MAYVTLPRHGARLFRSMMDESSFELSPAERDAFARDGFAGPFKLYEPEHMRERFTRLRAELMDRRHSIYTIDGRVPELSAISNYDRHLDVEFLARHICRREIVERLQSILGPDVLCWRSEFFPKYPGSPGTSWHQATDFSAVTASRKPQIEWTTRGPKFRGALTVWTAFTDSTVDNGCLQLMPGTHDTMYYDESKGATYRGEAAAEPGAGEDRAFFGYDYRELQVDPNWRPDESKARSMVMRAGEFMIFWSTIMHASHPHTRGPMRMGYTVRYLPTSARIFPYSTTLEEYGGACSLQNYGAVLVGGRDEYHHNRLRQTTTHGFRFETRPGLGERGAAA